ncbi:hypothetical protein [Bacillus sp. SRB_331]|uniref:hypothetical protein n=1 Tax=Bacillus sp. SRB_331 TaxID=1969379 RepID=UPI001157479C|nr:hypothetical protein [Bacillus sp. SRB_331]
MKTLIVPCAGKSLRFPKMRPKWLLTHPDGNLMIQKAVKGLNLEVYDRIIITIVKEHVIKYEADLILQQAFNINENSKFEILILDEFTSCQAETVYRTLFEKNVVGAFDVKDSDGYIEFDNSRYDAFIVGLDINKFGKEISRLSSKSFLIVDSNDNVVDIFEKKIKSEYICVGLYGFDDVEKFNRAYENIKDNNFDYDEIYLSHIISYLIGTGKSVYHYINASEYEDWGTLLDWQTVQKRHATYFVDVDGILLMNRGRYGDKNWSNDNQVNEENIKSLKELADEGAQIIIITARTEEFRSDLINILNKYELPFDKIVMGVNHSCRTIINDFAPTNPYPSCKAINIPRNAILKEYL